MRSNFKNFALAVAILGCAALVSGSASATPTLVGTTTNPTGINGLVVDGTIYNVTFSLTTFNSFTAGTTLSVDAATALAAALESLSVVELDNTVATFYLLDVDNSLTDFDAAELCTLGCGAWAGSGGHTAPNLGFSGISLSTGVVEAADFTAVGTVGVPEPLTFSLFGAGLAGAFAMRRRNKKSA